MRINSSKHKLDYFYSAHKDLKFFMGIWGISDDYLSELYGEYKYIVDATYLMGNGLYVYTWKYLSIDSLDVFNDFDYSYIMIPKDILPVFESISFKKGKVSLNLSLSGDISMVDYNGWFAIRVAKGYFEIKKNTLTSFITISYNDIEYDGFWIPEYSQDINYIENFFGSILGVYINRDLYKSVGNSSDVPTKQYSDPSIRIKEIHSRYAVMIESIVKTIMGYSSKEYYLYSESFPGIQYIYVDGDISEGEFSRVKIVNKEEIFEVDYNSPVLSNYTGTVDSVKNLHGYGYDISYRMSNGTIEKQFVENKYILSIRKDSVVYSGDPITNGKKNLLSAKNISESHDISKIEGGKVYIGSPLNSAFSKGSSVFLYNSGGSRSIKGHPSPSNIQFVVSSIMHNYAFNDDDVSVVDRVNSLEVWKGDFTDNIFITKISASNKLSDRKLMDVIFKILSYFKPIFTMSVVSGDDDSPKKDGVKVSDSLAMEKKELNIKKEYETFSIVAPTMRGKKKLSSLTSTSSIRDLIEYKYLKKINLGDINGYTS